MNLNFTFFVKKIKQDEPVKLDTKRSNELKIGTEEVVFKYEIYSYYSIL